MIQLAIQLCKTNSRFFQKWKPNWISNSCQRLEWFSLSLERDIKRNDNILPPNEFECSP